MTGSSNGDLPPVGGNVVEVGIRQGRLFLTFSDGGARERRLYLETDWHLDGYDFRLDEHSKEAAVSRLCRLLDAGLVRALSEEAGHLALDFGARGRLVVSGSAVQATKGDPWWLSPWIPAVVLDGSPAASVSTLRPDD